MSAGRRAACTCVAALFLAAGLAAWEAGVATGQDAQVRVVAPAVWPPDGGTFEVRVEVEGVTDLGAFEFNLAFDPAVLAFEGVEASGFLGSTGRSVGCVDADFFTPQHDIFAFACATLGPEPPGPSGAGVLATAKFHPIGRGPSPLSLSGVKLAGTLGQDIPVSAEGNSIIIGRSAGTPVPTATPVGPPPTATPLPAGHETLGLRPGCNAVASTYPDGTGIQTIVEAVGPAGVLESVWRYGARRWLGHSPRYPGVSDLREAGRLQALFVCVSSPAEFVRPVV